jgi:threonine dehydratase
MTPQEIRTNAIAAQGRFAGAVAKTMCLASRTLPGVHFKTENFQHTGSFKLRGALSKLTMLDTKTPVITASSGNHGIACSHAAMTTGHQLTVVLPENVARAKLAKIHSYGTKTILFPGDSGQAEQHAQMLAAQGYVYVSPYNDPWVMAGQGTIGLELLEQLPQIDNIFIAMGGGGLISGVGSVIKATSPQTRVIGVSASNSAALAASIRAGRVVEVAHHDTLADGCAGGMDDDAITLPIARAIVDELIDCSEDQIAVALRHIAWSEKMLVEGAAALALAPLLDGSERWAGQTNVVLLCGANFDDRVIGPIVGTHA